MKTGSLIIASFMLTANLLLLSCRQEEPVGHRLADTLHSGNSSDSCQAIILDKTQYETAAVEAYQIVEAVVEEDLLKLTVQYGGGCGTVNFELLTNGAFMESYPVQLPVRLSFQDNDFCKALLQEQVCFSLSALGELYRNSYQTQHGTIVLHLQAYEGNLTYEF